jgi:hypothetical protein
MEQWVNNEGRVFNSYTAIRNEVKDVSLPQLLTDSIVAEFGFIKVVDVKPTITDTQYLGQGFIEVINDVPTMLYPVLDKTTEQIQAEQLEAIQSLVKYFTDVTTAYIEGKVQEYNKANGLAFKDIDAFTKYAVNTASVHHAIANQFIAYADAVWTAVRDYQATTTTTVPTEEEFMAVLDAVVF